MNQVWKAWVFRSHFGSSALTQNSKISFSFLLLWRVHIALLFSSRGTTSDIWQLLVSMWLRSGCFQPVRRWTSASTSTPWCWVAGWNRAGCFGVGVLTQLCRFFKIPGFPHLGRSHAVSAPAEDASLARGGFRFRLVGYGVAAPASLKGTSPRGQLGTFSAKRPWRLDLLALQMVASRWRGRSTGCCLDRMGSLFPSCLSVGGHGRTVRSGGVSFLFPCRWAAS